MNLRLNPMLWWPALITILLVGRSAVAESSASMLVVVGAPGAPEYGNQFAEWANRWRAAARRASIDFDIVGESSPTGDEIPTESISPPSNCRERLRTLLAAKSDKGSSTLWIIFIGHGTFDGQIAKFNLRGPDLSAKDLAGWLASRQGTVVVVNCASASAPFINHLSGANRVIVTATKSGDEQNFARFGEFMSKSISDLDADVDKDGQVSLLEAFLTASRRVSEYYDEQARLATEHALLDDNGDGAGMPASEFRGVRAIRKAAAGAQLDGLRAHQVHLIASERESRMAPEIRLNRDRLEQQIEALRAQKDHLDVAEYYGRLESILLELARLYASQDSVRPGDDASKTRKTEKGRGP